MVYRGISFTIRTGIQRNRWTVVVHLPDGKTVEKSIHDLRHRAEATALEIIDKWLEKKGPA
jgi:hypothetical protein